MKIRTIKKCAKIMRIWEWWDKMQIIFAAVIIMALSDLNLSESLIPLIFLGVYLPFISSYGYVINSYYDRVPDTLVGKHSEAQCFTRRQHFMFLCVLAIPAIVLPMVYDDASIRLTGITIFLLATFYSAPPLRLKEKGILGPISAALVQRPLPFLLFALLARPEPTLALFLFGWLTLVGLSIMFAHQVLDYENDRKTNVNTWALEVGFPAARKTTIATLLFLVIYMFCAPLVFTPLKGVALSMVMIIFSGNVIAYTLHALKKEYNVEDGPE